VRLVSIDQWGAHGERGVDLSRSAACGYWQRKRALDGGLGPSGAHGRGVGAMEMGVSQGFGANGEMVGWVQGKVAVGMTGLARRNGNSGRNGSCRAGEGLTRRGSVVISQLALEKSKQSTSTHDTAHRDGPTRNILTPETQDQCESSDFEGDQKRFVNEEVPTSHKAHCVVDEVTGQANESTRDRVLNGHLSNAVVYQS
jgi:hypothetical protein